MTMTTELKNDILHLLQEMKETRLIQVDLYEELHQRISRKSDEELQRGHIQLTKQYNILKKFSELCVKLIPQKAEIIENLNFRGDLLLRTLRTWDKAYDHYSTQTILIRLELIFLDVTDGSALAEDKNVPDTVLIDIYSTVNANANIMINDEKDNEVEEIKSINRLCLLNEIANSLLEDITLFLKKYKWSFADFYNNEFLDEILYRLRNQNEIFNPPYDIIDQLCIHIRGKLAKKYDLQIMELVSLLYDQFYKLTLHKYHDNLQQFVQQQSGNKYTFEKFFKFCKLEPILSYKEQETYAKLFQIYCETLHEKKRSSSSKQSSSIPISKIQPYGNFIRSNYHKKSNYCDQRSKTFPNIASYLRIC